MKDMANANKKIATWGHNEDALKTSSWYAHGHRSYVPRGAAKIRRIVRRIADVKAARAAWREVY
jgi:hypothetical protein